MSSKQVENVFQQHLNIHETLEVKQEFCYSTSLLRPIDE